MVQMEGLVWSVAHSKNCAKSFLNTIGKKVPTFETHFYFQNYFLSLKLWSAMVSVHSCQISAFQDLYFEKYEQNQKQQKCKNFTL